MKTLTRLHLSQTVKHLTERGEAAPSLARATIPALNKHITMKIKTTGIRSALFAALALVLAGAVSTRAAILTWTNTASGNWNTINNWSPNQAPGSGDTAIITNAGVTVSLNGSTTVGEIILGTNGPGTVTLSLAGQTLTLDGPLTVNPSGSFTVDSGILVGNSNAVLSGAIGWTGGLLEGALTLASNGTLNITAAVNHDLPYCTFTNNGTVVWTNGTIRGGGNPGTFIYNYGLWNAQSDQTFNSAYNGAGAVFNNYGTFSKSGGTNTSYTQIASGVVFNQLGGALDVQSGSNGLELQLQSGGNLTGGYITTNVNGLTVLESGSFTVNGTVTGTNTVENAGNLVGTNVINGGLTWQAGNWNGSPLVTITSNSTLIVDGTGVNDMSTTVVTNNGTVVWTSGTIRGGGNPGTFIYNYGLWNAQSDQTLNDAYNGAGTVFNNYGTFRKSGGTNTSYTQIASGVVFNQLAGMLDVQSGSNGLELQLQGGGNLTGGYITTNPSAVTVLSAGSFTVNGTATSTNTVENAGVLVGANVINGGLNWQAGVWNGATSVTIASNSTLIVDGTGVNDMSTTVVTNNGTVVWTSGTIRGGGSPGTFIYNYGLWNAQSDQTLNDAYNGAGTVFNNYGTFRKSGGTNTSFTQVASGVVFNQLAGVLDVQSGSTGLNLELQGGGNLTGGYITTNPSAVTVLSAGNFTVNGTVTSTNTVENAGVLVGANVISGGLNWQAGVWNGATSVTIASNSTLIVDGTSVNDMSTTVVTNNGTVVWTSGTIRGGGNPGTFIYNYGLWNAQNDQTLNDAYSGSGTIFNNYGTFRKSGGTNTSYTQIASGVVFNQLAGVIDVQSGINGLQLALQGGGNLTGGYITTNPSAETVLSAGSFTVNGTVTGTNTVENAGNLVGANVINGALSWVGGVWNGAASVTIATNSTLIVAGGTGNNDMSGTVVTNNGTVAWTNGTISSGNGTVIYNYGLWDAQSDQQINNNLGGANTVFNNYGTLRKSGGTATTLIYPVFYGSGTVNVKTATMAFETGGGFSNGSSFTGSGIAQLAAGTFTISGNVNSSSNAVLAGGSLTGASGVLSGPWTWTSGSIASGSTLTIATNGVLVLAGPNNTTYTVAGTLTNTGTVEANNGTLNFTGAFVQTAGLTLMSGGNVQATQPIQINGGTLQGAGTITGSVTNNGTLDPGNPLGLLTITGNYAQTANGALNIVLAGLPAGTNYDRLVVNGSASLAGSFNSSLTTNINLLVGNQYQALAAGSLTGVYNSTNVPNGFALSYTNSSVVLSFVGVPGSLYRFAWAPIPAFQYSGTPFKVSIVAQDFQDNLVTSFSGTAAVGLYSGQTTNILSAVSSPASSSANWTVGYSFTPTQDMLVTGVQSYFGTKVSIWQNDGTLVVSQAVTSTSGTWVQTPLSEPVTLAVGQTYRIGALAAGSNYYYGNNMGSNFAAGVINQSYAYTSGDGFPTTSEPAAKWYLVDLTYRPAGGGATDPTVAPTSTTSFTNGIWSGNLTVTGEATNVVLRAADATGHSGAANPITVWETNDLALFASAAPNPVGVLSDLTYALEVLNPGPGSSTGVIITNVLPAGVSFVSASVSQGTCTNNGSLIICNLGTLTGEVTATATIVVMPAIASAVLTNVATVVRNEVDPNPTNNVATNTVTVGPAGVSIADTSVVEGTVGTTNAVFSLVLNAPSAQTVTVAYSTSNGTAVAGLDYIATNGVVTFAPGVTNQTIAVPVVGDVQIEPNLVFYVQLSNPTNATLVRTQAVGTIMNVEGQPGQVYQLVWNTIGNPQNVTNAFTGTLNALDSTGALATSFNPSASLSAWASGTVTTNVSDTGTSYTYSFPLWTYYPESRAQIIYLTNEVGAAGLMTALALDVESAPGVTLTNFTIRLRTTSQTNYPAGSAYWVTNGWTTVYQGNLAVTNTGWVNCAFSTPFYYNGTNNLLVDLSYSNAVYPEVYTYWYYTSVSATRSMYYYASGAGDPRLWYGTNTSYAASLVPNLQFTKTPLLSATLSTNTAAPFVAGVWTGPLTVLQAAPGVRLLADDGNGHTAWSNPFDVLEANDIALYAAATPNPVTSGSILTFQLTVANAGPTAATGVIVTNLLPSAVNLVSAVASQGSLSTNASQVVCNMGTLTNGVTATATIVVTPTLAGMVLTNVAMVVRNEVDANPTNNVATNTIAVVQASASIADTSVVEGNIGTTNAVFSLTLNAPSAQTVTINYSTANGTAVAGSDYVATNGVATFVPGTTNQTIAVAVNSGIVAGLNKVFYVQLSNPTNVTLVRAQAVGTIINDNGLPGQVYHFVWAPISPGQRTEAPFPVTITAEDYSNNVAASFGGTVSLEIVSNASGNTGIGTGTGFANYPLGAGNVDERSQVIYLASDIGGPGHITGLSLDINDLLFSTTFSNFTIRLQHTPLSSYSAPYSWDGSGWTVVYQTNLTVSDTGWLACNFTTPFDYDGVNNLMVDISFNDASFTYDSCWCATTSVGGVRSLMCEDGGVDGNPLNWSGSSNPTPEGFAAIPNISLAWSAIGLSPTNTGNFTNGVWSGDLTLAGLGTNVVLEAVDAVGHSGTANPLTLLESNDLALVGSATPNPVGVMSNLTFTLQAMNPGPNNSTGVWVTNTLPAGASFLSASASQGTFSTSGPLVIWNLGTLTGEVTATGTIVVIPTVPSVVLTNVAVVVRNEADANPTNNVATNTVTVGPAGVIIADTSVVEGNIGTTNAVFSLTLNSPSAQTVTADYNTLNGTAVAGTDYVATNGVVAFAPGVTNQTIAVAVNAGIVAEPSKMFYVQLYNPANAVLVRNQAVGTIINDNGLPGRVYSFAWSAISSSQNSGTAFLVTITAQDLNDNVAESFSGTVALSLSSGSTPNPTLAPLTTGNFTNGVWSGTVTVTGAGTDVLLQATDAVGHSGISNPFNVQMSALSFAFSPGSLQMSNRTFQMQVTGSSGQGPIVIYATTNLVSGWVPLYTNPATTSPFEYVDSTASNFPQRFYQAREP